MYKCKRSTTPQLTTSDVHGTRIKNHKHLFHTITLQILLSSYDHFYSCPTNRVVWLTAILCLCTQIHVHSSHTCTCILPESSSMSLNRFSGSLRGVTLLTASATALEQNKTSIPLKCTHIYSSTTCWCLKFTIQLQFIFLHTHAARTHTQSVYVMPDSQFD